VVTVRPAAGGELERARRRLADHWGDPIRIRGAVYHLADCDVLIAGDFAGLAALSRRDAPIAELVALNAFAPGRGVGTALLGALPGHLGPGFTRIRLVTTNDNLDALRFYQRRGWRLAALRPGAVDAARREKPSIPAVGEYGLPLRDEIDLVFDL
jgi:GNAT superfamily N-acetyltransferase